MLFNANKQHTIASSVFVEGIGLQTNQNTSIRIEPAEPNSGITFIREDLKENNIIKADCDNVVSTLRCTTLGNKSGAKISTVEHLMAALVGCGIDNALIYVKGEEIPIMDGSSAVFVSAINRAGVKEQEVAKLWYTITTPIKVSDEETQSEVIVIPSDRYQISTLISFDKLPHTPLQSAKLNEISQFNDEIANARTFCFYSEIEGLLADGLIKGGNADNAVVVIDKEEAKLSKHFKEKFSEQSGVTTHAPLRYENEPARHKLLDVMGDLSLVGVAFHGQVICTKPGHKINIALAKKIKQQLTPSIDVLNTNVYAGKPSIIDIKKIKEYLPHRYPFLLIDKVLHIGEKQIIAVKNATANEHFFEGHFPNEPVMPGVLVVEAMAQAGGIFILSNKEKQGENIKNVSTYFLKIDECRFRNKIVPGDSLYIKMDLVYQNVQRGLTEMVGRCFVNSKLCCEASLVAQVVIDSKSANTLKNTSA